MKTQVTEYPARGLQWQSRWICVPAAVMFCVLSAHAQIEGLLVRGTDVILPPIGGGGGGEFFARCPQGQLLTGVELRAGDDIDAIRPICVAAYGPQSVAYRTPYPSTLPGANRQLACTDYRPYKYPVAPVVIGMYIRSEGSTETVNNIHLVCGLAASDQSNPGQTLYPGYNVSNPPIVRFDAPAGDHPGRDGEQYCPNDLVAVGIQGRAGARLDAVGLLCGTPELTPEPTTSLGGPWFPQPPVALGRVQSTTPAPPLKTMGGEPPICARARDARARNSPATSSLETQCRDAGGSFMDRARATPVKQPMGGGYSRLGRLATPASAPPAGPAVVPVEQPPVQQPPAAQPPVAQGPAKPGNAFMPPTFVDGAQLWACANAVQGKVKGSECSGLQAGRMYCRRHGFSGALQTRADGTPDLMVAAAQPGSPVRAVNGEACTAKNCAVISELRCAP